MTGTSETDTETEKLKGFIVYKCLRLFIKTDRRTDRHRDRETQRIYCLQALKTFHKERQTETQRELGKDRSGNACLSV